MLAKCAKFCGAVTETAMFHIKRELREFAEDVEVQVMEMWYDFKDLFRRDEKF